MNIHDMKHHAAFPPRGHGKAHQAAALAWRQSEFGLQVLLVTSLTTGRWVLPKGWVEEGEAHGVTARRETLEEAGVSGAVTREPIGRYSYAKRRKTGKTEMLLVEVYALQVSESAQNWPEPWWWSRSLPSSSAPSAAAWVSPSFL